jgi:DNA-binding protein H-NS
MSEPSSSKNLLTKLIIAVIIIWLASALMIIYGMDNWSDRGTFGDLFGAINALFSGLAFAGLIYTIVLQREEIGQNREEITQNRLELQKSVKAQQKSQAALKAQVKQTHLTAKINAMNTLIGYYNAEISNQNSSSEVILKAKEKRKAIIQQIDDLIDGLDDSNIE